LKTEKDRKKHYDSWAGVFLSEGNIEKVLNNLHNPKKEKPFFLWKLEFPEVFEKGGFDIVTGNPPYIRQEDIYYKPALQKEYEIFNAVSDLYTYFYERGFRLLKDSGTLTFITSSKFLRARYGTILRKYLKENTTIKNIVNFGDQHMFEAITNTLIFIATKQKIKNNTFNYSKNIDELGKIIFPQSELRDSEWTIGNPEVILLKDKIESFGTPLKDWDVIINYGIKTGYNEAYIINEITKKE
jgi:type I restriction-modification system DNA methylase subunit